MRRYYRNPDNSELTQGNVVMAVRDRDAEALPERERWPRACSDSAVCNYIEYLYLAALGDKFKNHPERKKMELRCESKDEAEHLIRVMDVICADPSHRYKVTYF